MIRRRKRDYAVKTSRSVQSGCHLVKTRRSTAVELKGVVEKPFRPVPQLRIEGVDWDVTPGMTPLTSPRLPRFKHPSRALAIRRRLQCLSVFTAILSWTATALGYSSIKDTTLPGEAEDQDELCIALWGVSILQTALLVPYAVCVVNYSECIREAYHLHPQPYSPFFKSPKLLLFCTFEAIFHLFLTPPRVKFEFRFHQMHTRSLLTLNDLFFILILLRNYHSIQLLYWFSRFSRPRNYAFLSFAGLNMTTGFTTKAYLAAYALRFVLLLYGAFVILSGFLLFTVQKGTSDSPFRFSQNSFWAVGVLQTTVGYGEVVPTTYLGQLSIVINSFLGSCLVALITSSTSSRLTLTRAESGLYSELAYLRYKRRHKKQAVVMIQRWWKLMEMRKNRVRDGRVIVNFYFQMRAHRRVLAAAQGQKERNFDLQVEAFEGSFAKPVRALLEYLQPVPSSISLVPPTQAHDILRSEYRVYMQTRALKHAVKRMRRSSGDFDFIPSAPSASLESRRCTLGVPIRTSNRLSPQPDSHVSLAMIKLKLFQKVKTRLITDDLSSRAVTPNSALLMQ